MMVGLIIMAACALYCDDGDASKGRGNYDSNDDGDDCGGDNDDIYSLVPLQTLLSIPIALLPVGGGFELCPLVNNYFFSLICSFFSFTLRIFFLFLSFFTCIFSNCSLMSDNSCGT